MTNIITLKIKTVESDPGKETNGDRIDYIINKDWKALIPLLDKVGVSINRTMTNLLKLYPAEKVESATASW